MTFLSHFIIYINCPIFDTSPLHHFLKFNNFLHPQKLGIILVINGFKNWFYQKMSITTNVHLNWYSTMKKNQKDSDDFWHRKLTLKVKFLHFLIPPYYTYSQNWIFPFGYVSLLAKIFVRWGNTTSLTVLVFRSPGFPGELNYFDFDEGKCLIHIDRFSTKRGNRDGMNTYFYIQIFFFQFEF